jgi:hypothetical protein
VSDAPTLKSVPAVQRKRTARQIESAVWLRPRDIEAAYGISASTLAVLCRSEDPAKRIPSVLIVGRSGKRGVRLVKRADLDAYLDARRSLNPTA